VNQPDSETVAAPNLYDVTIHAISLHDGFAMRRLAALPADQWRRLFTLDQAGLFTELSVIDGCQKAERRLRNLIPACTAVD